MLLLSLWVSLLIFTNHTLYLLFLIFVGYFVVEGLAVDVDLFWIASRGLEIEL